VIAIVPTVELPFAIPFTSHVIVAPAAMQNDAVNDWVWPSATLAVDGEIEFAFAHPMITVALPNFELSAVLVAVTVTMAGDGGTTGAV